MQEHTSKGLELVVGEGDEARTVAVAFRPGLGGHNRPGLVWLGGYRSDMSGTKALELDAYAAREGLECLRFDYSGHGASGGAFEDGTISRWLEEALAVFDKHTTGPQILVGSSMGGWIALLMAKALKQRGDAGRLAGMLLLAPAPDFTAELIEPGLTDEQRADLSEKGRFEEPTPYGPDPNIYTRALIEDGRANSVLNGVIDTGCPVTIIQGMQDPDVPYAHALRLMEHLPADDVVLTLVRDGDHRLSRPADIGRMLKALNDLIAGGH